MISKREFIRMSLELNLFFARIMKEHLLFIAAGFTPKNSNLMEVALNLQYGYDELLLETAQISNGVISPNSLKSGEFVTKFTLEAEKSTQFYTGIPINTNITQLELGIGGSGNIFINPMMEQMVFMLNQKAIQLTKCIIQFKSTLLEEASRCRLFTHNYPLLVDHVLREAKFYLKMIQKLQNRNELDSEVEMLEQELFWNRIMAEHAKFIRGFLDPTEEELMSIANNFANEFDELTRESKEAMDREFDLMKITDESLKATREIRDFKAQGTEGILDCKVKSIILPLLGDHTLREANHYLRLLRIFKNG